MNTLPRAITAQIFASTESYAALRRHWSVLMRSNRRHELSAAHHLLYLALIGKDWRKSFTPISNRRKLDNGAFAGWELFRALMLLRSPSYESWLLAPFAGLVTPGVLQAVRSLVSRQNSYSCRPEDFGVGMFPFEAYEVPEAMSTPAATEDRTHA
jgi:hypothetical protein